MTHTPSSKNAAQTDIRNEPTSQNRVQMPYFLAPKLVLAFFASLLSVSLSSTADAVAVCFLLFLDAFDLPPPPPAVLAGVGALDAPLLLFAKLPELGVGAWEAGVDAGVCAS